MSRSKELTKNTIILTIGKICTQFVSFLLLPLYTAILLPEELGIVDLFNTYITLLVPLFNWQFENGLFRFMIDYRNDKFKLKQLFSTIITANVFQSLAYLMFYLCVQNFITIEYKIFLTIDVILNIFLNTLLQFPRGLGDSFTYAFGSFLSASATIVFNVIFIVFFRWRAYGMFMATVIAKIITLIFLIVAKKVWTYYDIKLFDKNLLKSVIKYSVPLIPNQLSWWVVGVSDRTIISYFMNVAANGVYSIANKFSSIFITFYNIFNMSWTESVSLHINDEDCDVFLTETINTMFKFFSSVCIGIIACMPFAFPLLIDGKYSAAYNQIPILMTAVLFQVVVGLYSVIYVALKKTVEIAKTSSYAAVINIMGNLLMIKHIGLYAASISTLLAYATMAIYRYFHVKRYKDIKLESSIIISTVLIGSITVYSYYINDIFIHCCILLVVIAYAITINKEFLFSILLIIKNKIFKRK